MSTEKSAEPTPEKKPGLFRRTLRHHWIGLLIVWLTGTLLAGSLLGFFVHPTYRSYSVLRVERPNSPLFGVDTSKETLDMFLETQVQLLTSPNVLTAAARTPKAANLRRIQQAPDVVQELKKWIDVRILPKTTLIEVAMNSPDSYEPAVLVNAVVESYLATNEEWATSATRNEIVSLERYLRDLQAQTDELERQWKEIVANGDADAQILQKDQKAQENPAENARLTATTEEYKFIKRELFSLHLQLVQAEAWAKELKDNAPKQAHLDPDWLEKFIKRKFANDPEVLALSEPMRVAKAKLDEVKRLANNDKDPAIRFQQEKYDSLNEKYARLWEEKSAIFRREFELTKASDVNDQELRQAEAKVRELQVKESALKKVAKELEVGTRMQATDSVKVQFILDQRSSLKMMQDTVHRRLEQLRYESRAETRVRKISEAFPANRPIRDLRPGLLSITPIVMLFATLGLFLMVESITGSRPRPVATPADPSVKPAPTDPTPEI